MHRSGTTLLTSILEKMGLYVGLKNGENNESDFFHSENEKILALIGGSWEHPDNVKFLLDNATLRKMHFEYLEKLSTSPAIVEYLGWLNYIKYRSLCNIDFPWGWKDPVNTYTLPLWLELFPNAKVIHIKRHGVDVAQSLVVRYNQKLNTKLQRHELRLKRFYLRPRHTRAFTTRCVTLEEGLMLWDEYLTNAEKVMSELPEKQKLSLYYEELLDFPETIITKVADFSKIYYTNETIKQVCHGIEKKRRNAFQNNPKLLQFAKDSSITLNKHRY